MRKNGEDLKLRTYKFSISIIRLVDELPNKRIYWTIADQLIRVGTSIGANIVEAKAASSRRDFAKFYQISLKSANETKYWLCLLRDGLNYNKKEKLGLILKEADEISNILGASLLTLKNKR